MARINVESKALVDHRIRLLGKKLGVDVYGALGRLVYVWGACVETGRYVLRPEEIDAAADTSQMAGAMLEAGLAREDASGYYIRGTEGQIEWLSHLRGNASGGGKVRAAKGKRGSNGRFATTSDQPSSSQAAGEPPANDQPPGWQNSSQPHQPMPSPLTLTLTPALEERDLVRQLAASREVASTPADGDEPRRGAAKAMTETVLAYLNRKACRRYTASDPHVDLIRARMSEGYKLEQFKVVIDSKVKEWGSDEKMAKHLRPDTLFCRKHFATYLDEAASNSAAGRGPVTTEDDLLSRMLDAERNHAS